MFTFNNEIIHKNIKRKFLIQHDHLDQLSWITLIHRKRKHNVIYWHQYPYSIWHKKGSTVLFIYTDSALFIHSYLTLTIYPMSSSNVYFLVFIWVRLRVIIHKKYKWFTQTTNVRWIDILQFSHGRSFFGNVRCHMSSYENTSEFLSVYNNRFQTQSVYNI